MNKTQDRRIRKVAVLGSGVMGSQLACHFANIGLEVILLDIVPFELSDEERKDKSKRNSLVNSALLKASRMKPAPLYHKSNLHRITTGNFDDDMSKIADCDWILEVVIERLDIKKQVFEKVEQHRKPGSLITSNTSGIPIEMMLDGRSDDFQKHFLGTHFFNPPRYLKLLEIIPSSKTSREVVDFFMEYGHLYLGKTTVECKDTPAFIANRIGVFSIMAVFKLFKEMGFTISEIDLLTGPISGKPKSATFRTADLVGIDTLVKVAKGVYENCPNDESREIMQIPEFLSKMVENKWIGEKGGQGFYKKQKGEGGKSEILELDINTMEYVKKSKAKFASVGNAKTMDDLEGQLKALINGGDKASEFIFKLNAMVFAYASNRLPEIANELYKIDDAIKAGFGWEVGPFENWDIYGVEKFSQKMEEAGFKPADWVLEMIQNGIPSFYKIEDGKRSFYDVESKSYNVIPGSSDRLVLAHLPKETVVWSNSGTTLYDIGEGVLNLEFHTKMNAIGGEVIEGINKAISIAEEEGWSGLVIGNDAINFSAGANLGMIMMMAVEQEWDELNFAIKAFQDTMMRVRYSSIPVVVAPHGLTLGGGCEMTMHADVAIAAAETYIGLVEVGVGLIPAGGGTKEMVLRTSDSYYQGDPQLPQIQSIFTNIATAKVATSAKEAFDLGILQQKDSVIVNGDLLITEAKRKVLELSAKGYTKRPEREDILVVGRTGLGGLYAGAESFHIGNYASDHDLLIANKLAFVMCGGDLSQPTEVSEQYLLDLEREAFLSLCGTQKTLERIQSILTTGKPLRN